MLVLRIKSWSKILSSSSPFSCCLGAGGRAGRRAGGNGAAWFSRKSAVRPAGSAQAALGSDQLDAEAGRQDGGQGPSTCVATGTSCSHQGQLLDGLRDQ